MHGEVKPGRIENRIQFELLSVYLFVLTAESFSLILDILVMIFSSMCGISYISENG